MRRTTTARKASEPTAWRCWTSGLCLLAAAGLACAQPTPATAASQPKALVQIEPFRHGDVQHTHLQKNGARKLQVALQNAPNCGELQLDARLPEDLDKEIAYRAGLQGAPALDAGPSAKRVKLDPNEYSIEVNYYQTAPRRFRADVTLRKTEGLRRIGSDKVDFGDEDQDPLRPLAGKIVGWVRKDKGLPENRKLLVPCFEAQPSESSIAGDIRLAQMRTVQALTQSPVILPRDQCRKPELPAEVQDTLQLSGVIIIRTAKAGRVFTLILMVYRGSTQLEGVEKECGGSDELADIAREAPDELRKKMETPEFLRKVRES